MIFEIDIDVYQSKLILCLGDFNDFYKFFNKYKKKDKPHFDQIITDIKECVNDSYLGKFMVSDLEPRLMIIHLKEYEYRIRDDSVIVHELFHAVHYLMNLVGIKLTDDSCEAWTYLLEHLYQDIMIKINKTYNS